MQQHFIGTQCGGDGTSDSMNRSQTKRLYRLIAGMCIIAFLTLGFPTVEMNSSHPDQIPINETIWSIVFVTSLFVTIQVFRIFVVTESSLLALNPAENYPELAGSFFTVTILATIWALFQAVPAIWRRPFDTYSLLIICLPLISVGTMIYAGLLWQVIRILFRR
jgi:hypothetical protein